jgi:DNA-binding response OmpR family regulator
MRILIAEDDDLLGVAVQRALTRTGFAVDWVCTGAHFRASIATHEYDFVVLDLGLPDARGEELLQHLRAKQPQVPIVITTARGGVQDRVALLDLGADDYLVKPFDLDELTARVRTVLRRVTPGDACEGAFSHGPLRLYPKKHTATWSGKAVSLTHREFWVLEALVRKRNQVLSRSQLEEALYGWGEEVDSNAIEVYIHYLRRKFGPDVIHTIRGVGYQLGQLSEHA